MSIEDNKRLVRRYFEDAPQHPEVCDEIFAPVIRFHRLDHVGKNAEVESTPEREKATYQWLKDTWGDWHVTIDDMIAEGDRVMMLWTFHGTHQGDYWGLPATGRNVVHFGLNIFRIEGGRIAEVWDTYDQLWLWQQLGALPETSELIAQAKEVMQGRKGG